MPGLDEFLLQRGDRASVGVVDHRWLLVHLLDWRVDNLDVANSGGLVRLRMRLWLEDLDSIADTVDVDVPCLKLTPIDLLLR